MIFVPCFKVFPQWDTVPVVKITQYPFTDTAYKPYTQARLAFVEKAGFAIQFLCFERLVRADVISCCNALLDDSCFVFSMNFNPSATDQYLTMAINKNQVLLTTMGTSAQDALPINLSAKDISLHMIEGDDNQGYYWGGEFIIPITFLQQILGQIEVTTGSLLKGNLYKTQFDKEHPHFGSLFKPTTTNPTIHDSASFGTFFIGGYQP